MYILVTYLALKDSYQDPEVKLNMIEKLKFDTTKCKSALKGLLPQNGFWKIIIEPKYYALFTERM